MLPPVLSRELVQQATENYTDMLHVAKDCFTTAMSVTSTEEIELGGYSEEWLLHYMLGKIGEKLRHPPTEYLDHYEKVTQSVIMVTISFTSFFFFFTFSALEVLTHGPVT